MLPTTLTHRERVRLALDHQITDRIPIAFVCSGINRPAHEALAAYLQRERGQTVAQVLQPLLDIKLAMPPYLGPKLAAGTDYWGVHRSPQSYGADCYSEIDVYPLGPAQTVADITAHAWPSPDWFDYSAMPELVAQLQADEPYCLMLANANIFESAWYMRGFEQFFVDLMLAPEISHAIMSRVTEFFVEYIHRTLSAVPGEIDLVFTADDIGGQSGLLMSLAMWEEHLQPYHRRINDVIHEHGAKVIYHSDGSVTEAVPGLIEMGIDVLQALQFDAALMDPADLKARFGDRLCFQGGVSVQQTLPFKGVQDVVAEVRHLIDTLGQDGGYILGPSHAIQAGTPPENIVAMLDEAVGYYPHG
jgi:uroporphyrinogen decarboxylase